MPTFDPDCVITLSLSVVLVFHFGMVFGVPLPPTGAPPPVVPGGTRLGALTGRALGKSPCRRW